MYQRTSASVLKTLPSPHLGKESVGSFSFQSHPSLTFEKKGSEFMFFFVSLCPRGVNCQLPAFQKKIRFIPFFIAHKNISFRKTNPLTSLKIYDGLEGYFI